MSFVLRPLQKDEILNFFDEKSISIMEYFIKKSLFSQPERIVWQKKLPVQIPKEHIEQWLVQSMWIHWIWAGSTALDVINKSEKWWADVKMLSSAVDDDWFLTNWDSWETSLAQKFKDTWNILDDLFKNKQYDTIKNDWLWIYQNKLQEIKTKHKLDNIYYFILIRWWTKLYLLWMEVLLENLNNTEVDYDRSSKKRWEKESQSVFIDWFLDKEYWYTKVYKAKKRLELRLKAKKWSEKDLCIVFDLDVDTEEINFLEKIESNDFDINQYWLEKINNIFSNK